MTLQEAYVKVRDVEKKRGFTLLVWCEDLGDSWCFSFLPPNFNIDDPETWIIGKGPTLINKSTGAIKDLGSGQVLDLPEGKPIPIEQFAEYNVAI